MISVGGAAQSYSMKIVSEMILEMIEYCSNTSVF